MVSLCFTMGYRKCPRQNCQLLLVRPGSPSNTWFLGPSRVHNPNGISIGTAASVALTVVSNRQADNDATGRMKALCNGPSVHLSVPSFACRCCGFAAEWHAISNAAQCSVADAPHTHIYMQTLDNAHNSQGLNLRHRSTALGSTCGQCHADS